ncbi:hypothetical protein G419_05492 [Rhodococcus triatomae BKS 15-14]|nr:hypothetical protein G419_05492 [Rhodococcus triatomae BKS 15-14]
MRGHRLADAIPTAEPDTLFELSARLDTAAADISRTVHDARFALQTDSRQPASAASDALLETVGRLGAAEHDLVTALRWVAATVRQIALSLSAVDHHMSSLFG